MAARQGPNIFSMKREKKDRDGVGGEGGTGAAREGGATGWGKETGKKRDLRGLLQITAVLHKPSRKWHSFSLL